MKTEKGKVGAFCLELEWDDDEDSIQDGVGEGRVPTISGCRDFEVRNMLVTKFTENRP